MESFCAPILADLRFALTYRPDNGRVKPIL